jgi:CRP-like cAMP-binding protein
MDRRFSSTGAPSARYKQPRRLPDARHTISDAARESSRGTGPAVSAVPFREPADGKRVPLLSERERSLLAQIASLVRFARGAVIYHEGGSADFVYNIAAGVVKTFRNLSDGRRHIASFQFAGDLFGLAEEGAYSNEAAAVTAVAAYRMPVSALDNLAHREPLLDYHLLLKLTHELREAQRHDLILARHDALGKIALFVQILEGLQNQRGMEAGEIFLPMSRSDIADYIGISLPAVSRAFRTLASRNIIRFSDRRRLQIIDAACFAALAAPEIRGTKRRSP